MSKFVIRLVPKILEKLAQLQTHSGAEIDPDKCSVCIKDIHSNLPCWIPYAEQNISLTAPQLVRLFLFLMFPKAKYWLKYVLITTC